MLFHATELFFESIHVSFDVVFSRFRYLSLYNLKKYIYLYLLISNCTLNSWFLCLTIARWDLFIATADLIKKITNVFRIDRLVAFKWKLRPHLNRFGFIFFFRSSFNKANHLLCRCDISNIFKISCPQMQAAYIW